MLLIQIRLEVFIEIEIIYLLFIDLYRRDIVSDRIIYQNSTVLQQLKCRYEL